MAGIAWDGSPGVPGTAPPPRATVGAVRLEASRMRHGELVRKIGDLAADVGERYGSGRESLALHYAPDSRKIRTKTPYRAGFPDLVAVGVGGSLFAELKCRDDTVSAAQRAWGSRLTGAGLLWVIWEPLDLLSGRIETELAALCVRYRHPDGAGLEETEPG